MRQWTLKDVIEFILFWPSTAEHRTYLKSVCSSTETPLEKANFSCARVFFSSCGSQSPSLQVARAQLASFSGYEVSKGRIANTRTPSLLYKADSCLRSKNIIIASPPKLKGGLTCFLDRVPWAVAVTNRINILVGNDKCVSMRTLDLITYLLKTYTYIK